MFIVCGATALAQNHADVEQAIDPHKPKQPSIRNVDGRAIAVLNRALAAHSRGAPLRSGLLVAKDTSATYSPITIKLLGPNLMRIESEIGGQHRVSVHRAAKFFDRSSSKPSLPNNSTLSRSTFVPELLIRSELEQAALEVAYVAQVFIDGRPMHHIQLFRSQIVKTDIADEVRKNSQLDLYIDAGSFLLAKVTYQAVSASDIAQRLSVDISFSDYRDIGGFLIPFRQTHSIAEHVTHDLVVTSFEPNVPLDINEF